jgi:hypothetical protein
MHTALTKGGIFKDDGKKRHQMAIAWTEDLANLH